MVVKEVFDKLKALQDILSQKYRIEQELEEVPKLLSMKTELLTRLKKSHAERTGQQEAASSKVAELGQQLVDAEKQREIYEKQMDNIKTQREYEALDKEIKDASEIEQQLRRDLQKEERNLEEINHAVERDVILIQQQEEELAAEQGKIKNESKGKQNELQDLKKLEDETIPGLDEEIWFKFERIIRSKAGLGIVPVKGVVCSGCHMILPAQFVNDVRDGDGILFCPYCSRILYYLEDEDEAEVFSFIGDEAGSFSDSSEPEDEYESDESDDEEDEDMGGFQEDEEE